MEMRDWLQGATASDVMVRKTLTLSSHENLAEAAAMFLREQISGAPVVSQSGECVGVLSVSDILAAEEKVEEEREKIASSNLFSTSLALPMSVYEEKLAQVRDKLMPAAEQPVSRFMTSNLVSVRGDASLATVVRDMIDAHVHRVVVLDDDRRLLGIISTMDVLAALLRAGN